MPDRDRRDRPADRARRYDELLDGRAADGSPLGAVLDVARDAGPLAGSDRHAAAGLDAVLDRYRATTARAAVPSHWRRRRSRVVRGAATATLTTKLVLGTVTAAAVGGITVVTVEHVRPSHPIPRPVPTSTKPSGSGPPSSSAPPSEGSFAPAPSSSDGRSSRPGSSTPASTSPPSSPSVTPSRSLPSGRPTRPFPSRSVFPTRLPTGRPTSAGSTSTPTSPPTPGSSTLGNSTAGTTTQRPTTGP